MRHLTWFLAAMFFASNATADVRACIGNPPGHEHVSTHASASKPLCPPSDDAGPCLSHYAQSYQSDEQKTWVDGPSAALISAVAVPRFAFQAPPKRLVVASAPPVVGPPLTILFGNFRN